MCAWVQTRARFPLFFRALQFQQVSITILFLRPTESSTRPAAAALFACLSARPAFRETLYLTGWPLLPGCAGILGAVSGVLVPDIPMSGIFGLLIHER